MSFLDYVKHTSRILFEDVNNWLTIMASKLKEASDLANAEAARAHQLAQQQNYQETVAMIFDGLRPVFADALNSLPTDCRFGTRNFSKNCLIFEEDKGILFAKLPLSDDVVFSTQKKQQVIEVLNEILKNQRKDKEYSFHNLYFQYSETIKLVLARSIEQNANSNNVYMRCYNDFCMKFRLLFGYLYDISINSIEIDGYFVCIYFIILDNSSFLRNHPNNFSFNLQL